MSKIITGQLSSGVIFGDLVNDEYIYLPGGEVGNERLVCVLERHGLKEDVDIEEASELVLRLALKPCRHPVYGKKTF